MKHFYLLEEDEYKEITALIEMHTEFSESQGKELRAILRLLSLKLNITFHERWDSFEEIIKKEGKKNTP